MAFPVAETSVLSGASIGQLHNWRRTQLFVPEIESHNKPMLYSLRDIIALRSVVKLRALKSLQKIRKAFTNMSTLELTEHPSRYSLVDTGPSIVVVQTDGGAVDVLEHPGQTTLAQMTEILGEFETLRGVVVDLRRPRRHLEVREQRLGGWPTIEGTRVPFDVVAELIFDGRIAPDEVSTYYPGVSAAAASDALDFAQSIPNWSESRASA